MSNTFLVRWSHGAWLVWYYYDSDRLRLTGASYSDLEVLLASLEGACWERAAVIILPAARG